MADEAAADDAHAVAFDVEGNGLTKSCGIVLDGEVAQGDVRAFHLQRVGAEGTHGPTPIPSLKGREIDVGVVVVGDDGVLGIFAQQFDVLQMGGYDEFFLIDAPLDEDYFMIVHEGATHLDGFADGAELARSVACHDDGVGVVEGVGSRSAERGGKEE